MRNCSYYLHCAIKLKAGMCGNNGNEGNCTAYLENVVPLCWLYVVYLLNIDCQSYNRQEFDDLSYF